MFRMTLLITRVITLDNNYRYDSVDDGGLLDGDAQGLHVEVEEGVEDGHGGGLEEEDELDPDEVAQREVVEHPPHHREHLVEGDLIGCLTGNVD